MADFNMALYWLKAGRHVRRTSWDECKGVAYKHPFTGDIQVLNAQGYATSLELTRHEIWADDWELVVVSGDTPRKEVATSQSMKVRLDSVERQIAELWAVVKPDTSEFYKGEDPQ